MEQPDFFLFFVRPLNLARLPYMVTGSVAAMLQVLWPELDRGFMEEHIATRGLHDSWNTCLQAAELGENEQ